MNIDRILERPLPSSLSSERAILGSILLNNDLLWEAAEKITTHDLSLDSHREIYSSFLQMADEGITIDIVTLSNWLKNEKKVEKIGGVAYLASLTEGLPRTLSIEEYIGIIVEKSRLRKIINLCTRIAVEASDEGTESETLLSAIQSEAIEIDGDLSSSNAEHVSTITSRVLDKIGQERNIEQFTQNIGYTTGILDLDRLSGELRKQEYTIIAGDTSSGKSLLAAQITLENALKGIPILWFSMEMTKEQLISRFFSSFSTAVTASMVRDPRTMPLHRFSNLEEDVIKLNKLPIYIDDTPRLPLDVMLARSRSYIRKYKIEVVVTDYLQLLLSPTYKKIEKDIERIEEITYAHRDLAKTENIHTIALSQYSRPADGKNTGGRLNRLKGSSSLEQSCHNAFLIEREEDEHGDYTENAEIFQAKNREGRKGRVPCKLDPDRLRFVSI